MRAADAGLAAVAAVDELAHGSLEAAEGYLELAEGETPSRPAKRGGEARLLPGVVRLLLVARQRGNLQVVAEQARRLQLAAEATDAVSRGSGQERRALALISLGITEFWTAQVEQAERNLRPHWASATSAACLRVPAATIRSRWPLSKPRNGWPGTSRHRTIS